MVEKKEGPHDLYLTILHTFLLGALVKVGIVLGNFLVYSLWVVFNLVF
jgi:hypothetical protein